MLCANCSNPLDTIEELILKNQCYRCYINEESRIPKEQLCMSMAPFSVSSVSKYMMNEQFLRMTMNFKYKYKKI